MKLLKKLNNNLKTYKAVVPYIKTENSTKYKVKRLFYASSSSVYGENKNFPLNEKETINPKNIYELPNGLDIKQAPIAEPTAVSLHAVELGVSTLKKPPILLSIIFAKTEGESNFGKQHQSIEESL